MFRLTKVCLFIDTVVIQIVNSLFFSKRSLKSTKEVGPQGVLLEILSETWSWSLVSSIQSSRLLNVVDTFVASQTFHSLADGTTNALR